MAKTQKVNLDGTPHVWEFKQNAEKNVDIYICKNCGLEGVRSKDNEYLVIFETRKTKKLIVDCKVPEVQKGTTIVMQLKKQYSDKELIELGHKLSEEIKEVASIEEEKKAINSELKGKIDAHLQIASDLSKNILNGGEIADVDCEVKFHFPELHKKTITRLDTNEVIFEDKMDDEDYTLFNQPETEVITGEKMADES